LLVEEGAAHRHVPKRTWKATFDHPFSSSDVDAESKMTISETDPLGADKGTPSGMPVT
jgi:hypothetical protein